MRDPRFVFLALAGLALAGAAAAGAALTPGRTLTKPAPIGALSVTFRTVVYAVGESPSQCAYVELWDTAKKGLWRFGRPTTLPCKEGPSTGSGVWSVASTARRALWITYVGGNFRDWELWTATPTKKTSKRLRFVSREVDEAAPIVVGPGTVQGVPYAVDREVVYLADNGSAIFKSTVPSPVRSIAAGPGLGPRRVVALLEDGSVVTLGESGTVVDTYPYPAETVKAVQLAGVGAVIQVEAQVDIRNGAGKKTVPFPTSATMLDYRQGRIYYAKGKQVRALHVATLADELLLTIATKPGQLPLFSLDWGAGWAVGKTVNWRT